MYQWTNLSKYPGSDVLGIFHDASPATSHGEITTYGITQTIKPSDSLTTEDCPTIPVPHRNPTVIGAVQNAFLSIETFSHVQGLKVIRVGCRCVALSIRRNHDTVDVLGQWDPTQPSVISDIYSHNKGILTSMTFSFSRGAPERYLVDISCGIDDEKPPEENEHSLVIRDEQLRKVRQFLNNPLLSYLTQRYLASRLVVHAYVRLSRVVGRYR